MRRYFIFVLVLLLFSVSVFGCDLFKNSDEPTEFTVIFKDYDGTIISTQQVKSGKNAVTPSNPEREGYVFSGWDGDFTNVTKDLTLTATYTESFTVTFKDYDGTILKTEEVESGQDATEPTAPEREGYTFAGWDVSITNVISDLIVTATYTEIITYTVTFKDFDGTVIDTQQIESGQDATAPSNPGREGYTFAGWDVSFSNVTSDLTVTATYSANGTVYTVTFKDYDGTVLETQDIVSGLTATLPTPPEREGYIFTGWEGKYVQVDGDEIIEATYTENARNIFLVLYTFNHDGTVTAELSLTGEVNVCGFEGIVTFDTSQLTYVSYHEKQNITSNYVVDTNTLYFVYSNAQDYTQTIPILDVTFNINDLTDIAINITLNDMFDQTFNDETYIIIN